MGIRVDKKKKEEEEKHFFLQQQREKGKLLKDVFFLKYVAHMKGREFPRHIQASAITATH